MDIQDLKNVWDEENPTATPVISLEKQKEIILPLEKIRKNMRMEFYSSMAIILLMITFCATTNLISEHVKIYVMTLLLSMILITAFYFIKFFKLYNSITNLDLNILDNLKELKFEFKLNEQYYYAYYIAFIPFFITEMIIIFEFSSFKSTLNQTEFMFIFISFCIFGLCSLYLTAVLWFKYFYGKYFSKISLLINDLK
ncbi:hypothetical protein [Frigoriflavimonas asaccharolytica]|uniref:Uncharacterized protein n=1 Tax=Frigoriflavimonas asaccharolytica TaxID=2735899 RepID=A0A8J8G9T9_9FLAO|nr:hypothetical protein [Frigoriflavimonas asaccharolytica]NRS91612.1 hypothetical protein [Frigoriflavimonas asaccharolytica]